MKQIDLIYVSLVSGKTEKSGVCCTKGISELCILLCFICFIVHAIFVVFDNEVASI